MLGPSDVRVEMSHINTIILRTSQGTWKNRLFFRSHTLVHYTRRGKDHTRILVGRDVEARATEGPVERGVADLRLGLPRVVEHIPRLVHHFRVEILEREGYRREHAVVQQGGRTRGHVLQLHRHRQRTRRAQQWLVYSGAFLVTGRGRFRSEMQPNKPKIINKLPNEENNTHQSLRTSCRKSNISSWSQFSLAVRSTISCFTSHTTESLPLITSLATWLDSCAELFNKCSLVPEYEADKNSLLSSSGATTAEALGALHSITEKSKSRHKSS